ncbi:cation:proton antiporter domain-containing protein [Rhizobium laguerreae]|uniref:cation:proton antiporter domain-containing protein n=1 Tax=Rhizobium laguerreae TaxID=1076926 RepID=UPI001FEF9F8E|nr:cation:proton antiporter [Rhizobium laguerreae]
MASSINLSLYSDIMVVLATAGVIVPVASRLGANSIIGFLVLGALLGPLGLGSQMDEMPFLYWITIVDPNNVAGIAELGVVFLLFLIGLQLSLSRLLALRRLVFGLGGLQVVITAAALTFIATLFGVGTQQSLVVGLSLALSSTATVVELLSAKRRMSTTTGRATFSVLLAQDLAVVPLLLLVGILASDTDADIAADLGIALLQAAASLGLIVLFGRVFLRALFHLVGSLDSSEVFLAAVLFIVVGAGFAAAVFGLPMALGAFVAGILLSETEYRKAVEAIVEPFKGLLLGVFFFTVGMSINAYEFIKTPGLIISLVCLLCVIKIIVLAPLARIFGIAFPKALEMAMLMAAGGEFAFVGIGAGVAAGIVSPQVSGLTLTVVAISMALTPMLATLGERLAKQLSKTEGGPELNEIPHAMTGHAIVIGYGRVGRVVAGMLERHGLAYIAIDSDPTLVSRERRAGNAVFFGDAGNNNFLKTCGLSDANALIVTINDDRATDRIIDIVRTARPDLPTVARARDATHARHLYAMGATNVVPETIEASLQLSEATLISMGIPMGKVVASIHERRDEFRKDLQ